MWQIYGQDHILRQLDAALQLDRLSHAYLLVGPPHVGKMALAVGMAQAVNCLAGGQQPPRVAPAPQPVAYPAGDNWLDTAQVGGIADSPPGGAIFGPQDVPPAGDPLFPMDEPSPAVPVEGISAGGALFPPEEGPPPSAMAGPPAGDTLLAMDEMDKDEVAPATGRLLVEEPPSVGSGPVPCGQCRQCRRIGQGLHPDIRIVDVTTSEEDGPAHRDIRIEQVRDIESFLQLTAYEGARKVVVVDGAELMNTPAANALLKTLEEPPPDSLLLLLTANEDVLLPTIRSRCSALYLKPMAKAELAERLAQDFDIDPETAERVARLSRGCYGEAVSTLRNSDTQQQREADLERLLQVCQGGLDLRFDYAAEVATQFGQDRNSGRELLYLWLRWWRDLLLVKEGAEDYLHNDEYLSALRLQASQLTTARVLAFIRRINKTLEALDANANPRLAMETLMLGLPRL